MAKPNDPTERPGPARSAPRLIRHGLATTLLFASGCAVPLVGDDLIGLRVDDSWRSASDSGERTGLRQMTRTHDDHDRKRWHIDFAYQVSYTKLAETKQMLDRRLDIPLSTDTFRVFSQPKTPLDRRSSGGLNALTLGFGRNETDWLTWTAYFAGGAGSDRQHQRWANLNLRTHFRYGSYRVGFRSEIYPWGRPGYSAHLDWRQRLQCSRPFMYVGLEGGYVSGEGRGTYSVAPRTLYRDKVAIRDWILGFPIGLGFRMPLDDHWSLTLMGDYTLHVYRPQEYSGWNLLAGIRYRF